MTSALVILGATCHFHIEDKRTMTHTKESTALNSVSTPADSNVTRAQRSNFRAQVLISHPPSQQKPRIPLLSLPSLFFLTSLAFQVFTSLGTSSFFLHQSAWACSLVHGPESLKGSFLFFLHTQPSPGRVSHPFAFPHICSLFRLPSNGGSIDLCEYRMVCVLCFIKEEIHKLWRAGAFNSGEVLMDHVKSAIYHIIYRSQDQAQMHAGRFVGLLGTGTDRIALNSRPHLPLGSGPPLSLLY